MKLGKAGLLVAVDVIVSPSASARNIGYDKILGTVTT